MAGQFSLGGGGNPYMQSPLLANEQVSADRQARSAQCGLFLGASLGVLLLMTTLNLTTLSLYPPAALSASELCELSSNVITTCQ